MKIFCITSIIVVFLLLCANEIHAQTTLTKPDQATLMKQFIGSWKCFNGKDTTRFWDVNSFGTGLECCYKSMTKGEIIAEGKELYGYDKNIDKCLDVALYKGKDIAIYKLWFKSENKYVMIPYNDISNSDRDAFKVEGEFKSPDIIMETITVDNKQVRTDTWTRIK
jgi:hypothetical protein